MAVFNGGQRRISIGRYPVFGLKAARAEARVIYGQVQRGEGPALSRESAKLAAAREREKTVAAVAKDWIKDYAKTHHKRWQETASTLNRLVLLVLGERPIDSITRRDAIALIESIAERPWRKLRPRRR